MLLDIFRLLVVVMLCMFGLLHGIWFLASWTSIRTGFRDGAWILPGEFTIRSPLGKLWGLGGLAVLALFSLGSIGLVAGDPGWTDVTNLGVLLSYGVVVPWWRQSPGSVGVTAVITDLVIMFLLALPIAEDITGLA